MRFALGLTVFGSICLPATAQTSFFDPGTGKTISWAETWSGVVTRMVSGDFAGDHYRHLVVLDGTQLVLAFAPGVFNARSTLGLSGVTDVCAVPGAAPGGVDGLVASDGSGWRKIWIEYPEPDEVGEVHSEATSYSPWINAKSLQALSSSAVVALDSSGGKILILTDPFGTPANNDITITGGGGLALAVVNWDGDANPDVAVLRTGNLLVYEPLSSTPIATLSFPSPGTAITGGALVGFHQDGMTAGRLAVLLTRSGDSQLWAVDSSGSGESAVDLDVNNPYALATGAVDNDDSDDLLVAHHDSAVTGPLLFINNECTGGSCITFLDPDDLSIGISALSDQRSLPVFDDFTADGDEDIAWFFEDAATLRVAENLRINHVPLLIKVQTDVSRALLDVEANPPLGALRIKLNEPSPLSTFTPNQILVEEWYHHAPNQPMQTVGAQAFKLTYPTDWTLRHTLFLWPGWVPMNGLTYLTIRPARFEDEELVEVGPASLHVVGLTKGASDFLEGLLGSEFYEFLIIPTDIANPEPPAGPLPVYPQGLFLPNTPWTAGGGTPPQPPPMGDGLPPKTPKPAVD